MEKQAPELQIPCLDTPWNGSSLPDISTTACMHWYTFHTNHFSSQIIKIPNLICTSHGKHSGIHICVLGDNVPKDIIIIFNDLPKNWVIFKHLDVKLHIIILGVKTLGIFREKLGINVSICATAYLLLSLPLVSWLVGLREEYVSTQLLRYWHWSKLVHTWLCTGD